MSTWPSDPVLYERTRGLAPRRRRADRRHRDPADAPRAVTIKDRRRAVWLMACGTATVTGVSCRWIPQQVASFVARPTSTRRFLGSPIASSLRGDERLGGRAGSGAHATRLRRVVCAWSNCDNHVAPDHPGDRQHRVLRGRHDDLAADRPASPRTTPNRARAATDSRGRRSQLTVAPACLRRPRPLSSLLNLP